MMAKKRNQYHIFHYKFKNLIQDGNYLILKPVSSDKAQLTSENILFNTLYRITGKTYDTDGKNYIDEIFVLNAENISAKEKDGQLELYKQIMREGVYIEGTKYVRFGKSSSMTMRQRTLFIQEDLHDDLKEAITLSKVPSKTVISKYEAALGLSLTSLNLIEGLPKIAIVKDFEKIITDDVKMVSKFEVDENDEEYILYQETMKFEELYKDKIDEVKELFTGDFIRGSMPLVVDKEVRSKNGWNRENKRIKLDQLDKPFGYKVFKEKDLPYLVYSLEQTEEKPNLINKFSLGYDVKVVENHKNEIVPFDGQGLVSYEYAKKLSEKLELKYRSIGYQIRMPYVKGLAITFDLKSWFKENKITHIKDLWNNQVEVDDLDIILTESCFKAKQEAEEGKNKWLFESVEDYTELLKKYGHDYIGVANYVKSVNDTDIYSTLNYQFLNSLNLNFEDIKTLATPYASMLMKIINKNDTASVKTFLNMLINNENSQSDRLDTDIQMAIDTDERMIFDPRVQRFIRSQVKEGLKKLLIGKIPIKSNYKFITGDCIAFMEYVSGKKVKGFLEANEFYCKGSVGEHVMMRNPLTSWHEVKKGHFINSDNKYIQHLNNVIQLNTKDLTMPQLSGADLDGDKVLITKDSTIINAVLDDLVIVNDDDKVTAPSFKYDKNSIESYEMKNLSNMTSVVTNINTLIQSFALEKGDLRGSELAIGVCKQLQAEFIDSVKKGTTPVVPDVLLELQNNKPYFQKFIYEDVGSTKNDYKYLQIESPLNQFCSSLERGIEKRIDNVKYFENEYVDMSSYDLITDMKKVDQETFFILVDTIAPIYNEYSKKKGEVWKREKEIKKVRANDEEKSLLKMVKQMYKDLYKETRELLNDVCDNPSVLTTVCAYIEYKASKTKRGYDKKVVRTNSYIFPWICTENAIGLLENLKAKENNIKVDIIEVPELNRRDKVYEGILIVQDGFASIEDVTFVSTLTDGKYRLINQMGYHYVDFDNERKSNIETSESESIRKESEDKVLKRIVNFKCRFVGMESGEDANLKINKNKIKLGKNGNYLGVFIEDEYVCGIAQEKYIDDTERIFLEDYVGKEFKVKVEKIGKKSLSVSLNIV